MKVLFLSQIVPYPPHGGVLQRGFNILRELGRRSSIHLLAFLHPDELRNPDVIAESREALGCFCASVEYFPLWAKASRVHRATAIAASAVSSQPFSMVAHRSAAFGQRVSELLQHGAADIVHVDTIGLDPFMRQHRRWPAVLTHHNIESVLMSRRAGVESSGLARAFLRRDAAKLRQQEATVTKHYDVNVVVSALDGATLQGIAPGLRTVVVPNGVDTSYFVPGDRRAEEPALIYTGGMNMFANRDAVMHFVVDVWPIIRRMRPSTRFIAVGQDPPAELVAIAARDASIEVKGYVDDIRPHVRRAAGYVVPLRVGGGTRLKVLDAMAMGKAIVSTSVGCEGIEARDGVHLVIADGPDALAAAAVKILDDPTRRRELGAHARALVEERYAWENLTTHLVEAYREAIASKPGARHAVVAR